MEVAVRRRTISHALALAALLLAAPLGAEDYAAMRDRMVSTQIEARGVSDAAVLAAMRRAPRHLFVPEPWRGEAYLDHPLPIGEGQTISQPYIVGLMTQSLGLRGDERVLEIGTGSGYQAAVLAAIVKEVYSIEIIPELAQRARQTLDDTGFGAVKTRQGDGYYGWPEAAPFDAVIVTAAANHIPPPLLKQLRDGGRLVIPVGRAGYTQTLTLVTKTAGAPRTEQLGSVIFVPLVGEAQKPVQAR